MNEKKDNKIIFTIEENIGILQENSSGWKREVNLVSWNLQPSKIDIREWDKDHVRMSRGITLTTEEGRLLMESLQKYFNSKSQEV